MEETLSQPSLHRRVRNCVHPIWQLSITMSVSSSATDRVESPLPPLLAQRAHPFPLLSALPSESRRPLNTTSRKSDSAMRRKTRVDVDGGGSRESEARLQAPFTSKRMKSSLVQVGCMLFLAAAAAEPLCIRKRHVNPVEKGRTRRSKEGEERANPRLLSKRLHVHACSRRQDAYLSKAEACI